MLTLNNSEFFNFLAIAAKILKKVNYHALDCIYFSCNRGQVQVLCSNLTTTLVWNTFSSGEFEDFLVDFKSLKAIVPKKGETLIDPQNKTFNGVKLVSKFDAYTDYPDIKDLTDLTNPQVFNYPLNAFEKLRKVYSFASKDETKHALCAVRTNFGDSVDFTATQGHYLAYTQLGQTGTQINLRATDCELFCALTAKMKNFPVSVQLSETDRTIGLTVAGFTLVSRPLEGKYPVIEDLVNPLVSLETKTDAEFLTVDFSPTQVKSVMEQTKLLVKLIQAASGLSKRRDYTLKLSFSAQGLKVSQHPAEIAHQFSESIQLPLDSEFQVGVNSAYFLDILEIFPQGFKLVCSFDGSKSTLHQKIYMVSSDLTALVMAVQLRD